MKRIAFDTYECIACGKKAAVAFATMKNELADSSMITKPSSTIEINALTYSASALDDIVERINKRVYNMINGGLKK